MATLTKPGRHADGGRIVFRRRQDWGQTLGFPVPAVRPAEGDGARRAAPITSTPIDEVTTDQVLAILSPIWLTKHETASRLRGRIERVLDSAKVKGLRDGKNPARWRGHLNLLLPKKPSLQRGHHAALPYKDAPDFFATLRANDSISSLGLQFLILTAARTGEVCQARWEEFDLEAKVWSLPAERMKAGRPHRVPLSDAALKIVQNMKAAASGSFVFGGQTSKKPMSNMGFSMLLRRMKRDDITVHGFRSTFRDWAAEQTDHPREIAEAALAHVVGDATERAYRRGDALEKKRALLCDWASHLLRSG